MKDIILDCFDEHSLLLDKTKKVLFDKILEASHLIISAIEQKNKLILFGNGGSAADAQHIAAEFTGRFEIERKALPAIALTTDTSALTAIANDYGFDKIFERQIEALASPGDILIGISTSGNSPNIIEALKKAKEIGCKSICLTGNSGGNVSEFCDLNLIVPSTKTARIQEIHILIGHILCKVVDHTYPSF